MLIFTGCAGRIQGAAAVHLHGRPWVPGMCGASFPLSLPPPPRTLVRALECKAVRSVAGFRASLRCNVQADARHLGPGPAAPPPALLR